MQTVGLRGAQMNLFRPKELSALPAGPRGARRRPIQHEKKFMADIMHVAHSLGLPCIHIEYYCGNTFYVKCKKCGTLTLTTCHNRVNRNLAGAPDIIGIAWAIETKHKTNAGPQEAKASDLQAMKSDILKICGIPTFIVNEGDAQKVIDFLVKKSKEKYS